MTFFYDLNKRLAQLANKQDAKQISEDAKASEPKSKLAESMDVAEAGYSAKAGRAGKDLGKPGKNFSKIAKGAAERYGSKEAGERVAGAVLNKLRHPKESIGQADEGNAFTGKLKSTPKGEKFKLGDKEFKDTSDLEEGFKEMDAWLASREKEKGTGRFDKKKISTGTVYTRKPETFDDPETDPEATGGAPKRRGRPKGKDKGPERVTAKSYKYKAGRPQKTAEDLDSDGVMMTRPTNCSSESIEPGERAEYNDEAGMTKDSLHTIVRSAKELERALHTNENMPEWVQEKIGQIKGMMSSVTDYMLSTHERDTGKDGMAVMPEGWRGGLSGERDLVKTRRDIVGNTPQEQAYNELGAFLAGAKIRGLIDPHYIDQITKLVKQLNPQAKLKEKAPPGAKAERMVKGIKKSLSKDGHLSDKDKAIAYATTWKAKKQGKVEEAGKPDFLDLDKDGDKKEPMKKAANDKKEEKVDETTVAGSVATAPAAKKSSGGMQFGKGVYEGFNNQVESMITESINVADTIAENEGKTITVTASGPEADMLMQLLKAAGLSGQSSGCGCGQAPCACDQTVDEAYGDTDETLNDPDWPTDTETLDAEPNLRTYSGGLNGPKSTGQTTVPVVASQERRLHSESVELERNLFKTWKNYKG